MYVHYGLFPETVRPPEQPINLENWASQLKMNVIEAMLLILHYRHHQLQSQHPRRWIKYEIHHLHQGPWPFERPIPAQSHEQQSMQSTMNQDRRTTIHRTELPT